MAGPCWLSGLVLVSSLLLLIARTEADVSESGSDSLPECCQGPDMPPRPRIMLLGETGVGKSTLGKQLFGKKPGMCASPNSMLNLTYPVFGVGHGPESHTNDTSWIAGKWLGDYSQTGNSSCFTVIDTPGVGDTAGEIADCKHGVAISEAVKKLSLIDAFVLIFKGTQSRFTKPLQDQLSFYEEMFGQGFWKKTIIEISYWRSREDDKEERMEDRHTDEAKFSHDLNMQLKRRFGLTHAIPVYFIDPMYTERRGKRNPEEKENFKNETEKLWNFTQSGDPYTCKGHCKSPGFLQGEPVLKSNSSERKRLKDNVVMKFSIWFSGCDGMGERSYDIYKDGVHIWTVIDEQGIKKKETKPKDHIKNEHTPPNMEVFDQCSQVQGKRMDCNTESSKYKNVKLVLKDITESAFGTYYVNNTNGRSQEVHIQKMVDGFYSEWSEWSTWDEVKGAKERTRDCTEPINGGAPCSAQGPPTEECNSDKCSQPSTYSQWSDWKCQEVCYNPYKKHLTHEIRTRTCTDANPTHSTQNCSAMSYTKDSSLNHCEGLSAVPPCPEMAAITTRVCSGYYDGTDDNVQLEFRNNFNSDPRETCMTDTLSQSGSEFAMGANENWVGNKLLLSCAGPRFRPITGLDVRFHTNTWGWNLHHDEVKLCTITAQFGKRGNPGFSVWQYNGNIENAHYTTYNSQSDWVAMTKIEG